MEIITEIALPSLMGIIIINFISARHWYRSYLAFLDEDNNQISSNIDIANYDSGKCEGTVVLNPSPSVTYIKYNQKKNYIKYSLDKGKTYVLSTKFTKNPVSNKLYYGYWKTDGDVYGYHNFEFDFKYIEINELYEDNQFNMYGISK